MTAAGTTSDLYMEKDGSGPALAPAPAPPAAAAPAPPPQPVVVKRRMADEKPDGSMRDTSTEALRKGNDLGFRNVDDEAQAERQAQTKEQPPVETKPEPQAAPKPPEKPPEPPKLYASKYKTPEDLEKAYEEIQKAFTKTSQEKAELERKAVAEAAKPPAPVVPTPEQTEAQKVEANRIINDFVQDPVGFRANLVNQARQETLTALAAQQMTEQWRKANPDLVEHELRVAFEATQLIQSNPELAKNPAALFEQATTQFRQFTGKLRTEGAKEALTTETRVIPLSPSTTSPEATEHPAKAPLSADEAYAQHMAFLKTQEQRSHRGLRR